MKRLSYIFLLTLTILFVAINEACACSRVVVRQNDNLAKVFSRKNTKYVIREDVDLGGKKIIIGEGSSLVFQGGSLANGTIVGNNTKVKADNYEIFKRGYTRYRAYIKNDARRNDPPSVEKKYYECIVIEGTWNNKKCGSRWTGLLNGSKEDAMLAMKNFVMLHSVGSKVKLPRVDALGYESTTFPGGYTIDFNNTTISYPDDLNTWIDASIKIPADATACPMETGYGLITVKSNTTISNLTIDGKSTKRPNETPRLGVSCVICVGNSKNVKFENVNLNNIMGPAMVAHTNSKDLTFKNCRFYNVGEHIMYSQQYKGFCVFEGCIFDTWDSERISVHRNGLDYVYKHTPYKEGMDATFEELYNFDLRFNNCIFNNPQRVNSQNRTLGGFLTGNFPVLVKVDNCTFNGISPILNPGGGSTISEKSGKMYRMVVTNSDGAPYVYPSRSNFNIITEFYNCKNIPFRVVYAKRYENCQLQLDVYEDNIENVSTSFASEFSEPIVIKNCEFIDNESTKAVNHPLFHRPVVFEKCVFTGGHNREKNINLLTIKNDDINSVTFDRCDIDTPKMQLVSGNDHQIEALTIKKCDIKATAQNPYSVKVRKFEQRDNIINAGVSIITQ